MKTQSIFKVVLTGAIVSTIALSSCENNDNTHDSNSEKTEGDVNDPTKYNSGSDNGSTRTGGSVSMKDQDEKDASDLVSENNNSGSNTQGTGNSTSGNRNSGMNTSKNGTDLGGTSGSTKNITGSGTSSTNGDNNENSGNMNQGSNNQGMSGTTGQKK